MTPEEYQKIKAVFHSAIALEPVAREIFLREKCFGEENLKFEAENLLKNCDSGFMEENALSRIFDESNSKKFEFGDYIGRFRIIEKIGAGGMGKVFSAYDQSLNRKVAIKVLLDEFSGDSERARRFKLEAQAASALNHPNIITIYEIGEDDGNIFIAAEYIKGKTLSEILENEQLTVSKAVVYARQILEALAEAHEANIIHRDIKPSNIIVTPKGQIKILDFGLAKFAVADSAESQTDSSTTGVIMGTFPYMSPEQLCGKPVDVRTDIFSFGALFYEMLTGKSAFLMKSKAEITAAILNKRLDYSEIPLPLQEILHKCLRKDKNLRYADAGEILEDLRDVRETAEQKLELQTDYKSVFSTEDGILERNSGIIKSRGFAIENVGQRIGKHSATWVYSIAGFLILGLGLTVWNWRGVPETAQKNLSVVTITDWKRDLGEYSENSARFSPDGKLVAFASTRSGVSAIWIKQLNGGEPFTRKQDNYPDRNPIFSPDGQQIAFISERENQTGIWQMPTFGGAPVLLKVLEGRRQNLLRWAKDGNHIYFEQENNLLRLELSSKKVTQIADFKDWKMTRLNCDISSDEQKIAFVAERDGQSDIWMTDADGNNPVRITNDEFEEGYPAWHTDGKQIIYNSLRNGISQIFTVNTDGSAPRRLIFSDNANFVADVSPDGRQIIYSSQRDESDIWEISVADGREKRLTENAAVEMWANPAPDGKKILYQSEKKVDISRKITESRIYMQSADNLIEPLQVSDEGFLPSWSPDGRNTVFLRAVDDTVNLWTLPTAGGEAKPLTKDGVTFGGYSILPFNRMQTQDYQWSSDSGSIIFCARRNGVSNVWQVSADGTNEKKLTENTDGTIWFNNPLISADGKKIIFLGYIPPSSARQMPKQSIWVYENGTVKQIYESDNLAGIVGLSSDGEIIVKTFAEKVTLSQKPENIRLFKLNADTGKQSDLAELKQTYFMNITLSSDKKTLAFVRRNEGKDSIRTLSLQTRKEKILATANDTGIYFAGLAWSSDGQKIYFGKQLSRQIISMIENYQ